MFVNILVPLIVTPFILKALDPEAYGLISIGLMLQAILAVLEAGFSSALLRTFAERGASPDQSVQHGMHDLLRTLEYFYLALAGIVCLLFLMIAPLIAKYWLVNHALSFTIVWQSIALIGLVIAIRFFAALYGGGLSGLQRQVLLNKISIALNVLSSIGAIVILLRIIPDPRAYFAWYALMGAITAVTLRWTLLATLPASPRAGRFDWTQWQSIKKFSLGMNSLTVTSLAVTQADKVLLSRLLALKDFGLYSIAANVAGFIQYLTVPVQSVYYPRMTQAHAQGDTQSLIALYKFSSHLVLLLVFPLGCTLTLFGRDTLLLWLRAPALAEQMHVVFCLLAAGSTLLTSLMMMPYALTLAHADTKITLRSHVVLIGIQIPAVIFAAMHWGAIGAAGVWCALFSVYGPLYARRVNQRYLPSGHTEWLWGCVLKPALPALIVVGVIKLGVLALAIPSQFAWAYLPAAWGLSLAAAWVIAPLPGVRLRDLMRVRHGIAGN